MANFFVKFWIWFFALGVFWGARHGFCQNHKMFAFETILMKKWQHRISENFLNTHYPYYWINFHYIQLYFFRYLALEFILYVFTKYYQPNHEYNWIFSILRISKQHFPIQPKTIIFRKTGSTPIYGRVWGGVELYEKIN